MNLRIFCLSCCTIWTGFWHYFASGSLKVGDKIPHFILTNQDGDLIDIADYPRFGDYFILYFYPKDNTPGCTTQACAFNNVYSKLKDLKVDLLGVSGDSESSHSHFAGTYDLKFSLLSDVSTKGKKTVRDLFGLKTYDRVTFIINKNQEIVFKYDNLMKPEQHIFKVMRFFEELEQTKNLIQKTVENQIEIEK